MSPTRGVAIISKVGRTECLVLYLYSFQLTLVLLTDFIFNHTFLLNMLYDYIIIYD